MATGVFLAYWCNSWGAYVQSHRVYKTSEGLRLKLYTCPAGKLTIGYGYNIEDLGIPQEIADRLFEISYLQAQKDAKTYLGHIWDHIGQTRQEVITDMSFNMGLSRLSGFKGVKKALANLDFAKAADEMLDSKWARQVGKRARTWPPSCEPAHGRPHEPATRYYPDPRCCRLCRRCRHPTVINAEPTAPIPATMEEAIAQVVAALIVVGGMYVKQVRDKKKRISKESK